MILAFDEVQPEVGGESGVVRLVIALGSNRLRVSPGAIQPQISSDPSSAAVLDLLCPAPRISPMVTSSLSELRCAPIPGYYYPSSFFIQ